MPTPRQQAEKHNKPAGEKSYCGVSGTPNSSDGGCDYTQYKEWGANTMNAGSADADDEMPATKMGNGGSGGSGGNVGSAGAKQAENGNGGGGAEKKQFPGGGKPFGK